LSVRARLALALIAVSVLLPGTFGTSLFDRDEGWYAQVSREMVESGDWVVPHYRGQPWLAKPPLLYWCIAAGFKLCGVHDWAARLVPIACMLVAVQLLATLTQRLFDTRTAIVATLTFITALLPAVVGRLVLTDSLLLVWVLAACVLLHRLAVGTPEAGAGGPERTLWLTVGFWACVGLGVLTKGPAIVLFAGAFGLALWIAVPRRRGWMRPSFWLGALVAVAIAAPWFIAVAIRESDRLAGQFLWSEVFARLVSAPHGQTGPPGYHAVVALGGWFPWSVLVPGALIEAWAVRRREPSVRAVLWWLALPWALLEVIPSKLPHYTFPCYAAVAMLLARMWLTGAERAAAGQERLVRQAWALLGIVLGLAVVAFSVFAPSGTWSGPLGLAGAVLAVGFAAVALLIWRGPWIHAWAATVATMAAWYVVVGLTLLPSLEPHRLSRRAADAANARLQPGDACVVAGYTEPTLFFYLRVPASEVSAEDLPLLLRSPRCGTAVIATSEALASAGITDLPDDAAALRGLNYAHGRTEQIHVFRVGPAAALAVDP